MMKCLLTNFEFIVRFHLKKNDLNCLETFDKINNVFTVKHRFNHNNVIHMLNFFKYFQIISHQNLKF